jgi:hypothetical protein
MLKEELKREPVFLSFHNFSLQNSAFSEKWYPRPELNRDGRFRKPLLYPFEVQGHKGRCQISAFTILTQSRKVVQKAEKHKK